MRLNPEILSLHMANRTLSAHTRKRPTHHKRSVVRRLRRGLPIAVCLALLVAVAYRLIMPGTQFLLRFKDASPEGDHRGYPFDVQKRVIDNLDRQIPIRIYKPKHTIERVIVLVHGVHYGGYDEPRLIHFSKRLAGFGYAVVTPEIADLKNYDIQPRALYDIERTVKWVAGESGLTAFRNRHGVDLFGISFAGGLCLSAAGRDSIGSLVASVFSFGGHADLDETMAYLVTGRLPDGQILRPHIYGQAVLVRRFAEELVPSTEVAELRRVLLDYLSEKFKSVRADIGNLGDMSRTLVNLCMDRKSDQLGVILAPIVRKKKSQDILSPVRGKPPSSPVFLLHGYADSVIPPSQTLALKRWASPATHTRALISDLFTHVELGGNKDHAGFFSYWNIIRFWTELLR